MNMRSKLLGSAMPTTDTGARMTSMAETVAAVVEFLSHGPSTCNGTSVVDPLCELPLRLAQSTP